MELISRIPHMGSGDYETREKMADLCELYISFHSVATGGLGAASWTLCCRLTARCLPAASWSRRLADGQA